MTPMSPEFIQWRCLIALAHADERVAEQERQLLEEKLEKLDFSPVERRILANDFVHPQDPLALYESLEDEEKKREVIQTAFALFWADGEFHKAEQQFFMVLRKMA